jgi:hypothetical protein
MTTIFIVEAPYGDYEDKGVDSKYFSSLELAEEHIKNYVYEDDKFYSFHDEGYIIECELDTNKEISRKTVSINHKYTPNYQDDGYYVDCDEDINDQDEADEFLKRLDEENKFLDSQYDEYYEKY